MPATLPAYSVERGCFRFYKVLAEFVRYLGALEGNPFTFSEVKTLLDGVTVGCQKIHE